MGLFDLFDRLAFKPPVVDRPAFISQMNDLQDNRFFDYIKILKKGEIQMVKEIKVDIEKVQANFVPEFENKKAQLELAKKAVEEKAKERIFESDKYKEEVERHEARVNAIAEEYVAEQVANDRNVIELEAAVKVFEAFTVVEEIETQEGV